MVHYCSGCLIRPYISAGALKKVHNFTDSKQEISSELKQKITMQRENTRTTRRGQNLSSESAGTSPSSTDDCCLDNASLATITELLRLSRQFRQSTSQVRRIQRGSPGAGALGAAMASFDEKFIIIEEEAEQVFLADVPTLQA